MNVKLKLARMLFSGRQEKVSSGKLEFIQHSLGRVLHGPGADAGSGPEIPPREGRTRVLDHLLVTQAFDLYGLSQPLTATLGRVPQPYFITKETEAQRVRDLPSHLACKQILLEYTPSPTGPLSLFSSHLWGWQLADPASQ